MPRKGLYIRLALLMSTLIPFGEPPLIPKQVSVIVLGVNFGMSFILPILFFGTLNAASNFPRYRRWVAEKWTRPSWYAIRSIGHNQPKGFIAWESFL